MSVVMSIVLAAGTAASQNGAPIAATSQAVAHLKTFPIVEFRRYTVKPGEREHFAQYFASYFPEAFEQLGAIAYGQFLERDKQLGFTWIRGFHDIDARAIVNSAFYYGPLWKEHSARMNDLMDDSDNVLLLHPLSPERGIPVLPAFDVVKENAPHGIVVAQVFAVKPGSVENFAEQAEPFFSACKESGMKESGVLVTLDVPNNFPRLPVRTDGPFLVWLGIAKDEAALSAARPKFERSARELNSKGLLRGEPELIVMDPAPRSRLRWLPEW